MLADFVGDISQLKVKSHLRVTVAGHGSRDGLIRGSASSNVSLAFNQQAIIVLNALIPK
jgi:hypothetical protein